MEIRVVRDNKEVVSSFKRLKDAIIKKIKMMIEEKSKSKISIFSFMDDDDKNRMLKVPPNV